MLHRVLCGPLYLPEQTFRITPTSNRLLKELRREVTELYEEVVLAGGEGPTSSSASHPHHEGPRRTP